MAAIITYKEITAENPSAQVWKLLRHFRDVPSVAQRIREQHGLTENQDAANVRKQATQIGYCIRQAEEYFQAAAQVGVATRPNLLYYGAVSLSQALVLLRQDGAASFDALDKNRRARHHGLDLIVRSLSPSERDTPADFFASVVCELHTNDGVPWGHFTRFYRSLVPCAHRLQYNRDFETDTVGGGPTLAQAGPAMPPVDELLSRQISALELLKGLPDLFTYLKDLEIEPDLCRGFIQAFWHDNFAAGTPPRYSGTRRDHRYHIEALTEVRQRILISRYADCQPPARPGPDYPQRVPETTIVLYQALEYLGEPPFHTYPEIVDDIGGKLYYLVDPDSYIAEPAAMVVLLFGLGMLCRYQPHIWIRALDSSVAIAELTDLLLNVIQRKFPNLILDQLTGTKNLIHV